MVYGQADCTRHSGWVEGLPPVMNWCKCAKCGHIFTDGYFSDAAMALLMQTTQEAQHPGKDAERRRDMWAPVVERVSRFAPLGGAWFDVGCGGGALLAVASEFGYSASGIDVRSDVVADLADMGFDVDCVSLEQHDGGPFGVVSMFDVLEHLPFPCDALRVARSKVTDGGVLAVSVPNMDSHAWRSLDDAGMNPYWIEIEHYHNFTRSRLTDLLTDHGFAVESFAVSNRFRLGLDIIARAVS